MVAPNGQSDDLTLVPVPVSTIKVTLLSSMFYPLDQYLEALRYMVRLEPGPLGHIPTFPEVHKNKPGSRFPWFLNL